VLERDLPAREEVVRSQVGCARHVEQPVGASDSPTRCFSETPSNFRLTQSNRIVNIVVYYKIRPFTRISGTKVD